MKYSIDPMWFFIGWGVLFVLAISGYVYCIYSWMRAWKKYEIAMTKIINGEED